MFTYSPKGGTKPEKKSVKGKKLGQKRNEVPQATATQGGQGSNTKAKGKKSVPPHKNQGRHEVKKSRHASPQKSSGGSAVDAFVARLQDWYLHRAPQQVVLFCEEEGRITPVLKG